MASVVAVVGAYYFFSTGPPALMVSLMKRQPLLRVLRANMYSAYMDLVGLLLFGVLTAQASPPTSSATSATTAPATRQA